MKLADRFRRRSVLLGVSTLGLSLLTNPEGFQTLVPKSRASLRSSLAAAKHGIVEIPDAKKQLLRENLGELPLIFEVNQGQSDPQVKFMSRGSGVTVFLNNSEVVLVSSKRTVPSGILKRTSTTQRVPDIENSPGNSPAALRIRLLGANPRPRVVGSIELPGKRNYFIGNDPKEWHVGVPTYSSVEYQDVYPGINLVFYGTHQQLEYDFTVAPGADARAIKLEFGGAEKLEIDAEGDLLLRTQFGEIRQHKPLVYQTEEGFRKEIPSVYVPENGYQVGFQVAAYDIRRPLVIDPVLSYSSYLGGGADDIFFGFEGGDGISVDAYGSAYVAGITGSDHFPVANPLQPASRDNLQALGDCFVAKLDATGSTLVYATYLGGNGYDACSDIAVDLAGNAYVVGSTTSSNFPTKNALQPVLGRGGPLDVNDAFVTKLNPAGSALVYSTYLGGASLEYANGIALDAHGSAYVTGRTDSYDFPTADPFQQMLRGSSDAFVTKLDPTGTKLVYSTYLGGTGQGPFPLADEDGRSIAVDDAGNAYVTRLHGVDRLSDS